MLTWVGPFNTMAQVFGSDLSRVLRILDTRGVATAQCGGGVMGSRRRHQPAVKAIASVRPLSRRWKPESRYPYFDLSHSIISVKPSEKSQQRR